MKVHAGEWISAYHDGELHGARLAWVEQHLAGCDACRAELEQLRKLSALLKSVPTFADQAIPGRFTGQAPVRLPPAGRPGWQKVLETGWQALPLGLLLVWAFGEAALFVGSLALSGGFGELFSALPLSGSAFWEVLAGLAGLSGTAWISPFTEIIPWLGLGESFFHLIYLNLALTLVIGVFLWGWLASWWVYRTRSTQWITLEF